MLMEHSKLKRGGEGDGGAVIRNGEVAKAGAGNISHTMGDFHAEMIAAQEGIRLAAQSQILVFPPRN